MFTPPSLPPMQTTTAKTTTPDLWAVDARGEVHVHVHPGQWRAWESLKRFILVLAGTQGGKTSFGPLWLWREIRLKGPGDYIVAAPTFRLLNLKLLPEFRRFFEEKGRYGTFSPSTMTFTFSPEGAKRLFGYTPTETTRVLFGHAQDPDSLESATAKGAWLDEAGQKKFKRGSWEAILRRLSLNLGRVLLTTTPYEAFGWIKSELYDRWKEGDPDVDVIRFESRMNPMFPLEEWKRSKRTLPKWKFDLMYRGMLTRPAGMIYDCWLDEWEVPAFTIPSEWRRFVGLDFGGTNTAAVFLAEEPAALNQGPVRDPSAPPNDSIYYLYREYLAGQRTAAEHNHYILEREPRTPLVVGGAKSEGQWRREFRASGVVNGRQVQGLPIREPPIADVEVGIQRVYGLMKAGRLRIFDSCTGTLDQVRTYSRKLDENDQPTEEIEDKNQFHFADALRYIGAHLNRGNVGITDAETAENIYR